jgi:hypothetical protein
LRARYERNQNQIKLFLVAQHVVHFLTSNSGKRKLFPRFLAALVGILTSEKDSKQSMRLRAKVKR